MTPRIISVYRSSNGQLSEHTSSAVFFGELKNELHIDPSKETITVRETKIDLVHDQAQLPEGEFTIFIAPKKVKSGAGASADYEAISYNDLRKLAKERGVTIPANSKKPDIIDALKKADKTKVKGEEGVGKAKTKVAQKKAEVASKTLETSSGFSAEDRQLLVNLTKTVHAVTDKLNMLLEEAGFEKIPQDETLMKDLPADQKPVAELSEKEKQAQQAAEEKAAKDARKKTLADEAKMLGL